MVNFNVLIATIGRPSLQRMLNSLLPQLQETDHLTVVFDGHSNVPLFDFSLGKCQIHQYSEPTALGQFGHGIRNKYAPLLFPTTFVMHADDDDMYISNIFDKLRQRCTDGDTLYVMQMQKLTNGFKIPDQKVIAIGCIGIPCGIIPYNLNTLGTWGPKAGGDGEFYVTISKSAKHIDYLCESGYLIELSHNNSINTPANNTTNNNTTTDNETFHAYYGTDNIFIDVTAIIEKNFRRGHVVLFPKNTAMNVCFGDPCPNVEKKLKIIFLNNLPKNTLTHTLKNTNERIYVLAEQITNDTIIPMNVPNYIFYPHLDGSSHDIGHTEFIDPKFLENMQKHSNCIAFNTLGYYKEKIDILEPESFIDHTTPYSGIYVRSDYPLRLDNSLWLLYEKHGITNGMNYIYLYQDLFRPYKMSTNTVVHFNAENSRYLYVWNDYFSNAKNIYSMSSDFFKSSDILKSKNTVILFRCIDSTNSTNHSGLIGLMKSKDELKADLCIIYDIPSETVLEQYKECYSQHYKRMTVCFRHRKL